MKRYKIEIIAEVLKNGKWISNPDPTFVHKVFSVHFGGKYDTGIIPVSEVETEGDYNHPCFEINIPWFILLGCNIEFSDLENREFQTVEKRGKPDNPSKRWEKILHRYGGGLSYVNHVHIEDFEKLNWSAPVSTFEYSQTGFQNLTHEELFYDQILYTVKRFKWLSDRYDDARLVYGFVQQQFNEMGVLCIDIREGRINRI